MSFKRLFSLSLASFTVLSVLSSCSSNVAPAGNIDVVKLAQDTNSNKVFVADVGNGQKTPASISFKIKLSDIPGFSVKDSSPGTAAKTKTDLNNLKFYLLESNTGSAPEALAGTGFTYTISATNRTNNRVDITFTNVASNSTGKSYYIAAAGFSAGTYTAADNITNLNAPIDDTTEGKYYVSNGGGDAANPGAVRVEPITYALSGTAALSVPLKLLDAVTPTIDSDVIISSGSEISTNDLQGSAN